MENDKQKPKPFVYIASPYTKGDPCINARSQMEIFDDMLTHGIVLPYIPLLSHFQHTCFPRRYKDWIKYDTEILPFFDACLRLPAKDTRTKYFEDSSTGADNEVRWFKDHHKPVFYCYANLYNWARTKYHR